MCGPGIEAVDIIEQAERDELESKIHDIVKTGHNCTKSQVPWSGMYDKTVHQIMDVIDEEIQKQSPMEE